MSDEPTGNLDSTNAAAVIELLLALRAEAGMTLVLVTHDEALAARADRRIHIKDGRIADGAAVGVGRAMTLALLAYRNLLRRPARTLLLVFGIALAIATALALLALSRGIERSTADSARERGADLTVSQRDASDIFSGFVDANLEPTDRRDPGRQGRRRRAGDVRAGRRRIPVPGGRHGRQQLFLAGHAASPKAGCRTRASATSR